MVAQQHSPGPEQSLQEVYVQQCELLRCKKNSYLLKVLPAAPNSFDALVSLDLSLNFVGRVGLRAVLEVIRVAQKLEHLTLADNWIDNQSIREVISVISGLPQLHYLDLSRNPISHTAGRLLSEYVGNNPGVYSVVLAGTLINPALIRIIQQKAEANRLRAGVSETGFAASGGLTAAYESADQLGPLMPTRPAPRPILQSPIITPKAVPVNANLKKGGAPRVERFPQLLEKAMAGATAPREPFMAFAFLVEVARTEQPFCGGLELLMESLGRQPKAVPLKAPAPAVPPTKSLASASSSPKPPLASLNAVFEVVEDAANAEEFLGMSLLCSVAKGIAPDAIRADLPLLSGGHLHWGAPLRSPTSSAVNDAAPDEWYAMRLIYLLVQKEQQSGNDNWSGLASVLSLMQREDP